MTPVAATPKAARRTTLVGRFPLGQRRAGFELLAGGKFDEEHVASGSGEHSDDHKREMLEVSNHVSIPLAEPPRPISCGQPVGRLGNNEPVAGF
jgi:hypothetical protein